MLSDALILGSGGLVGFLLGLLGGGGSILAVPLLLYVVGVPTVHQAIGTSALAVSVGALANLANYARGGQVRWRCAGSFAGGGVGGAWLGSTLGKLVNGQSLLILFALLMLVIAASMLRPKAQGGASHVTVTPRVAVRLVAIGFAAGTVSGFFGIGGGFLIVPGIMLGSGLALINAIGSSLFSVTAFGATTALNYAASGLVDWWLAAKFIGGGILGGLLGVLTARKLSPLPSALPRVFAGVVALVAVYLLIRSLADLGWLIAP
jgi:uncharacterized membrane protein YfcA